MSFRYEWDPDKNRANQRKHGLSFETAARVFKDPLHLSLQDRTEGGELRWETLGRVGGVAVILVAHTLTEAAEDGTEIEVIRIISARVATRRERKRYEDG